MLIQELETLLKRWESVTRETPVDERVELTTRTEALFLRHTNQQEPFVSNLRKAVARFDEKNGQYASCNVLLKNSAIGILRAFKSNLESGFIVDVTTVAPTYGGF